MLKGKALGRAIEEARLKKKVSKRALAAHFGVKPPSVSDWVARGTISKDKLPRLWEYFSDVVGSDHWGLARFPGDQGEPPRRHATVGPRNAPAAETAIALTAAEPPPSSLIYASPPELSWSQLQAMPAHTLPPPLPLSRR